MTTKELKLACQTFVGFERERLVQLWKTQSFRSTIQPAINEYEKNYGIKMNLKSIKVSRSTTFQEYLDAIQKQYSINLNHITQSDQNSNLSKLLYISFVKSILSNSLESFILLDRYNQLIESNYDQTYLMNLFDYHISPRNIVLISVKTTDRV
ncbi:hypothetical protein BC833DRAFT_624880 [Globomyces pollinis-pini]|nr:hypothetical protein BC833DRAFT_624880 [Globomyces pollinis-pini]